MRSTGIIQFGTPSASYYDGILMRANPMLHQEAFALLSELAEAGSRVIDVGCGQGAFAARLRDNGYCVYAVDKNSDDFRAEGVEFVAVDFDNPVEVEQFRAQHGGCYDVAVGMEVIEHVENPWEYCRFLLSLVRPGGTVLLTTPNVESVASRVDFLFTGLFSHFTQNDYATSGHINPLTFHELHIVASGVGAEVIHAGTFCSLPWIVVSRRPSTVLKSVIGSLLRPFMGAEAGGDIICFVLKRLN